MESQKKNKPKFRPNPKLKLMDQVRAAIGYWYIDIGHPITLSSFSFTTFSPRLTDIAAWNDDNRLVIIQQKILLIF